MLKILLFSEESDFITLLKHRYKRAFVNWKRSASQGFGGARLKLGDYYYYGQGNCKVLGDVKHDVYFYYSKPITF